MRILLVTAVLFSFVSSSVAQRYSGEAFPVLGDEADNGLLIVFDDVIQEDVFGVSDSFDSINWYADLTLVDANAVELHDFGYHYANRLTLPSGATLDIEIRGWADDESLTVDAGNLSPFDLDQLEIVGTYRNGNLVNPFTATLPTIPGKAILLRENLQLLYDFPPAPASVTLHESVRTIVNYQFRGRVDGGHPDLIFLEPNLFISNIRIASWINQAELFRDGFIRIPGDANLDGVFDSSDLIAVFAAGQYEDDVVANSVWATGDWNGDGEFDTSDMVVAFAAGGYVAGASVAVPEPSTFAWLWFSALPAFVFRRRRRLS